MVSYFKTQWFRIFIGLACLVYCIVIACTSTTVADSVEGLYITMQDTFRFLGWFLASCFWFIMSYINYHEECLKKLNERIEALETRAITDIEETSPNHYIVKRRLGPDKE